MKPILNLLAIVAVAIALSSCAEMEKEMVKVSPPGGRFDAVGEVTMFAGQPCTSQIMFDFQTASSMRSVWLAAGMRESKLLTDAAKHRKRVRASGVWKRGPEKGCNYVEVKEVTPAR